MNIYKQKLILFFIVLLCTIGSGYSLAKTVILKEVPEKMPDTTQNNIKYGAYPWVVRSVDTQVVSRHWENVSRESIREQLVLIKETGANYVAIGTPYDRLEDLKMWVEEAHAMGLNVWFRSYWNEWLGREGAAATMKPNEYLDKTYAFIINNPELFQEGDSFTVCMEAEEAGVGLGKRFLNYEEYKNFLIGEIVTANNAFEAIGMKGKIYTNWLSVNGWIVDNIFDEELVKKIGLITVDHYVLQTSTIGETDDSAALVNQTIEDLDRFHEKFDVPILLGEWGYQIFQPVSDVMQANVINQMFIKLKNLDYLVGINYWTHMGNTASIFGDEFGTNTKPRLGSEVLRYYYNPLSFVED